MVNAVHAGLRPATRLILVLLALSPLALAVPALMIEEPEAPAAPAPLPARARGARLAIDQVRPIAGFAINAHHISNLSLYLESVDRIAALGANALIVFTPMIQKYVESNEMEFVEGKCATDEQLAAILQRGRERGLHTTLLPIVFIQHPDEDEWRGVIEPASWDAWWANYDKFIDRFVAVANQGEADMLIIGSELNSTEDQLDRWKRVAERVRAGFNGQIAYSANWDRYDKVKLWPLVDLMCVSSYFELVRDDPKASEGQLVRAWSPLREAMLDAAERWDKPLVLSEVGYPSVPWASAHPWNYVIKAGSKADHEAQAKCWRAFFRAWTRTLDARQNDSEKGHAAGFFGYCWSPYYHGDDWDTGYGIEGKPAYDVVRDGFAVIRATD